MDFIDRLLALSEQTGWEPIDIYFFHIFLAVFLFDLIPWFLPYVLRKVCRLFRWLRSRRKKAAD